MSGFYSTELHEAAMAAGCDEFICKPIKFSAVPTENAIQPLNTCCSPLKLNPERKNARSPAPQRFA